MSRVKRGVQVRRRHKKILERAKGYRGRSKNCYRLAIQRVEKGLQYAYMDRRNRKRDFRALWIQRINAAVRLGGVTYAQFMHGLKSLGIVLDRKSLAALAVEEKEAFNALLEKTKTILS